MAKGFINRMYEIVSGKDREAAMQKKAEESPAGRRVAARMVYEKHDEALTRLTDKMHETTRDIRGVIADVAIRKRKRGSK